jgi:CRP/FNR family cyclic AMP-dependent transcriptional regulator
MRIAAAMHGVNAKIPHAAGIVTFPSHGAACRDKPRRRHDFHMNAADLFKHETETTDLAAGGILFKEGDAGDCMFVLLEGAVDVRVGGDTVEKSARGALLGEMALIDRSPRGATVVATEPSRLVRVDERRFNFIIQQNPFFARHVMKVLVDRLRHMNETHGAAGSPSADANDV